ncbi:GNAT family N-acetyltransferase [Granulosicoccus antarcticus]|uniref:BioF2-like acetyltransferase domain-containing protein n=1 Tax=Granulosicoccus antarcticus IMCC3135 TaxID=1192854 RepID=A0A2Z2NG50_9GAMM|nr:GNAT family N-acetyltransferase [Granulosicoccus antarcticus]ASJ70246.1 hypothetical protein IMCC3135_00600 [Granulosicoccus antarcticus IMCC3135]
MAEPLINTHIERLDEERISKCGWLKLFSSQAEPRFYHHPDWILAADENLLQCPVELACVHQGDQLKLMLPLQARAQRHRFHAPRHDHLTLGDVLIHPRMSAIESNSAIQSALSLAGTAQWDWQICNVPERSALLGMLAEQNLDNTTVSQTHAHWEQRPARQSAWFDLQEGLPPASGKLRRNLKRLRHKLQEAGQLRMQWVRQPDELPEAYSRFLHLEASGWKGAQGESTAIAADPALTNFYRRLLAPRFEGLQPVIILLWLDEECIAAQFGLQTGQCLSLLKIAYSEQHSQYSPGSLLLQDTAEQASKLGLSTLSLVSSPSWAERWHPHTESVWHLTRYANNPGGLALRTLDRLKQTARARVRRAA